MILSPPGTVSARLGREELPFRQTTLGAGYPDALHSKVMLLPETAERADAHFVTDATACHFTSIPEVRFSTLDLTTLNLR